VELIYNEEEIENAIARVQVNVDEYKLCHVIRNIVSHGINLTVVDQAVEIICFVKHYEELMSPFYTSVHPSDIEDGTSSQSSSYPPSQGLAYVRIEVHDKGQGVVNEVCVLCILPCITISHQTTL
jgi:hypothetical protein